MQTKSFNSNSENYVTEFENYLAIINKENTPQSIPLLVELFEDNSKYDELMFSIIHSIERFDDETYLKYLLPELEPIFKNLQRFATILVMRILNNSSTKDELEKAVPTMSESTKDTLKRIFINLRNKDAKWISLTENIFADFLANGTE